MRTINLRTDIRAKVEDNTIHNFIIATDDNIFNEYFYPHTNHSAAVIWHEFNLNLKTQLNGND